jgi:DNA-binding LacI/PurR family transcriptional regulator
MVGDGRPAIGIPVTAVVGGNVSIATLTCDGSYGRAYLASPGRHNGTVEAKRATLRDVAAAAGVSRALAGFVLGDDHGKSIPEATRERVRAAARSLGYAPHGIARALREGSSRVVVLSIDPYLESNYSRTFARGLDEELAAHGHMLVVRHEHAAPAPTAGFVPPAGSASPAGLASPAESAPAAGSASPAGLASPASLAPLARPASERQVLDALSPRAVIRLPGNYLRAGHELDDGGWAGGFAANVLVQVRYLADRGHAEIAVALPDGDPPLGPVRMRFAREAAARAGLPEPPALVVPRSRPDAAEAVRRFRAAYPAVTAVAAYDDDVALRVLAAARALGLTVPGDLAVIGFDDTDFGALVDPALTTVHVDAEEHGRKAAREVLGLDPGSLARFRPGRVIVRESA